MGYYTDFTVTIDTDNLDHEEFKNKLEEHTAYSFYWNDNNNLKSCDSITWCYCEEDILRLAKEYPDKLIIIYGEGEEAGDIWKLYVKNGKSFYEKATIVFTEFTEDMLE